MNEFFFRPSRSVAPPQITRHSPSGRSIFLCSCPSAIALNWKPLFLPKNESSLEVNRSFRASKCLQFVNDWNANNSCSCKTEVGQLRTSMTSCSGVPRRPEGKLSRSPKILGVLYTGVWPHSCRRLECEGSPSSRTSQPRQQRQSRLSPYEYEI